MKISAIVPTRNSERTLAACLSSLRNQTHDQVEIIVVDNASTDQTPAIADELADIAVQRGPERSAQRNHGASLASGDIILFIDSDMVLEPTVLADIAQTFAAEPEVGAVVIPERSFGQGFLAECRALEKSLYVGEDSVEAPRAFRAEVYAATGGWDETLTAAEDWDLADRTRALEVGIARVNSYIWHDEGRIDLLAQYGKKKYYGRWVADYLDRDSTHREHLARPGVWKQVPSLARHPQLTAGMVVLKSVEAAGLFAGMRARRREASSCGGSST